MRFRLYFAVITIAAYCTAYANNVESWNTVQGSTKIGKFTVGASEELRIGTDQAQTTKENFSNIAEIVTSEEPVVMISSNYHMDRAVRNASESGFSHVMRLPAPSGFLAYGANMLSEVVLDLNDFTK